LNNVNKTPIHIGITWRFAKFLWHHQIMYTECTTATRVVTMLSCTLCKSDDVISLVKRHVIPMCIGYLVYIKID